MDTTGVAERPILYRKQMNNIIIITAFLRQIFNSQAAHVFLASYPGLPMFSPFLACNVEKHGKAWVRGYVF
jgi:hypothetical protein